VLAGETAIERPPESDVDAVRRPTGRAGRALARRRRGRGSEITDIDLFFWKQIDLLFDRAPGRYGRMGKARFVLIWLLRHRPIVAA
jgi:hypothetical protein